MDRFRHGPQELGQGLLRVQCSRGQRRTARAQGSGASGVFQWPRLRAGVADRRRPDRQDVPLCGTAYGAIRWRRLSLGRVPTLDDSETSRDVPRVRHALGRGRLDDARDALQQLGPQHAEGGSRSRPGWIAAAGLRERPALPGEPAEGPISRPALQRLRGRLRVY